MSDASARRRALAVAAIVIGSALLNLWNNGFPLGYHVDEPVKVGFVQDGTQDFRHPILLLQLVRAANGLLQLSQPQEIAQLGRGLSAACGAASVILAYLIARRTLSHGWATMVAASVAASPTLVVHAHYLKEDTLLTTCLLLVLLCLLRWAGAPGRRETLGLGLALGLALSSQYKSLLLLPVLAAAPLLMTHGRAVAGAAWRRLGLALALGGLVFLVVNAPLLQAPEAFRSGLAFEGQHALSGHDVRIRASDFWWGFHLRHSLAPGMGAGALALGLAGLLAVLLRWRQAPGQDRVLALYALVFLLVQEASPLKPFPDHGRYVLPIVPVLLYAAWRLVARINAAAASTATALLTLVAGLVLVALPLRTALRLTDAMGDDTRARAERWLRERPGRALREEYAGASADVESVAALDLARARAEGVSYAVASSFKYGRFFLGSTLPGQDAAVYETHRRYLELFRHPYVELAPEEPGLGFSNPVIRIVDIRVPPPRVTP